MKEKPECVLTLGFHAHKAGLAFVTLNEEEDLLCRVAMMSTTPQSGDTVK